MPNTNNTLVVLVRKLTAFCSNDRKQTQILEVSFLSQNLNFCRKCSGSYNGLMSPEGLFENETELTT